MKKALLCVLLAAVSLIPAMAEVRVPAPNGLWLDATWLEQYADEKPLPNFSVVHRGLLRGGQPTRQGMKLLKRMGVRTVVSLQTKKKREDDYAQSLGLNFVRIPVDIFKKIPDNTVQQFLSVVDDPAMQPVYVHCRQGVDRTGVLIAIYRMQRQSWTAEEANAELRRLGHHWYLPDLRASLGPGSEESIFKSIASQSLKFLTLGLDRLLN